MNLLRYCSSFGLALLLAGISTPSSRAADKPMVEIETSLGTIVLELNPEKAPESVRNFLEYVDSGFYNGTVFHRVIPTFMIQGGGLTPDLNRKPTKAPIKNEATNKLSNRKGTVAMARTMDPNSATSQFFINVQDNAALDYKSDNDYGYAVFGQVTSGMDVVEKIKNVKTGVKNGMENVPVETVLIKSIKRKK